MNKDDIEVERMMRDLEVQMMLAGFDDDTQRAFCVLLVKGVTADEVTELFTVLDATTERES